MKCKPDIIRLIFYLLFLSLGTYVSFYFLYYIYTHDHSRLCEGKNPLLGFTIFGFMASMFPSILISELLAFNIVDIVDDNVHIKKLFRKIKICRLQDIKSVKHTNIKQADAYYYKTADNSTFIVMKHMFKNYKEMTPILNGNLTIESIFLPPNFITVIIIWLILTTINGLLLFGSC